MKHKKIFVVGATWLTLSVIWFIFTIITPIIAPAYKSNLASILDQLGFFAFLFGLASSLGFTLSVVLIVISLD